MVIEVGKADLSAITMGVNQTLPPGNHHHPPPPTPGSNNEWKYKIQTSYELLPFVNRKKPQAFKLSC